MARRKSKAKKKGSTGKPAKNFADVRLEPNEEFPRQGPGQGPRAKDPRPSRSPDEIEEVQGGMMVEEIPPGTGPGGVEFEERMLRERRERERAESRRAQPAQRSAARREEPRDETETDRAAALFRQMVEASPAATRALIMAGIRAGQHGPDLIRACELLEALTEADGKAQPEPDDLAALASAHLDAGNIEKATELVTHAIEMATDHREDLARLQSECLLAAGKISEAAGILATSRRRRKPPQPDLHGWQLIRAELGIPARSPVSAGNGTH